MFSSSSNGISPFSQVSPFLNWNPSSSSLNNNHESSPNLLSHQEDLLSLYFSNVSPTIDTSSNNIKNPEIISHSRTVPKTKTTKKTDRHSKIFTAQGPRDRRVRLSIDISKKFFGLQDLLGFDKASLTLDWLFSKSKTAISELFRANNIDIANCSFLSEDRQEGTEADENSVVGSKETITASKRKGRKRKPQMMSALDKAAKESRMKARQRARERTRAKISLRNILGAASQEQQSLFSADFQWGQIGSTKSADSSRQSTLTSSNEHSAADPVEGFFFVNPRTGEVNIHHHQEDAFSESANFKTKLDFNLWRSSMDHDDLF